MGLIDSRYVKMLAALFLAGAGGLYAQNIVPGQLGMEIQAVEQTLSKPGASPVERHGALARIARLRQLSGNIAEAAANWLDAAAADPGDASALVSGAYCLAAIGEWEKAALTIRPLLASGRAGPVMLQAWFLDACLRSWSAGDVSALAALAGHPEFTAIRPLIFYTLWQTLARNPGATGADNAASGGAETWKSRLLVEFPQSPEARAVRSDSAVHTDSLADYGRTANPANEKDAPVVSAVQSPLWQLLPGTVGSPTTIVPAVSALANAVPTTVAPAATAASTPAKPVAPATPASAAASGVVLQTGLFSKEANARVQSEALRKAGFTAFIFRKLVNGAEHWAVTVPAGLDQRKTAADLKKAGFDSFPVK